MKLEHAKELYRTGNETSKKIALEYFSEAELSKPDYTITEEEGNIQIEGTIGSQFNSDATIEGKMFINVSTQFKGGIWRMNDDGTETEMMLIKKK